MWQAHQAGATMLKIFPALAGGPAALKAILAPMPFLRLVPTNGVDLANAAAYLEAGAHAVGLVTSLFDPAWVAAGRWDAVEERAREILAAVRGVARPDNP
jgi:2-dehydro-3-deoxyphosphogluconate aldolase/(4S)-4-hydroxy-2-oxoglutarate aldolase